LNFSNKKDIKLQTQRSSLPHSRFKGHHSLTAGSKVITPSQQVQRASLPRSRFKGHHSLTAGQQTELN